MLGASDAGHPGDHGAAPDLKVRALKQVRHMNLKPQKTPPLCSRSRLHLWQVRRGAWSKRLPGSGLGRLTSWLAAR
jgi:hypothetical protein